MAMERKEFDPKYQWRLEDLYPTEEAWMADLERVKDYLSPISAYQGRLGESGETLLDYLHLEDEVGALISDVAEYVMRRADEDTRVALYQDRSAQVMTVWNQLAAACSFESSEVMAIPEETLEDWYQQVPGLALYRRYLGEIRRKRAHILSPAEERLLAAAGELSAGPDNVFSMLNNADLTFPDVSDGQGNLLPLTKGSYISYLESENRTLRQNAYRTLLGTYGQFQNTFAAALAAQTKQLSFFAKTRNYPSSLAAALDANDVPEEIYHNLIEAVHQNLPKLHRYVSLRKKLLGVEELHGYDLFVPVVKGAAMDVSYEEAKAMALAAVAPLGEEYVSIMGKGMEDGWIDVYENTGKRSGAYSSSSSVHPYVLMNYQGKLNDAYTLIHEMGHSMHTWYSNHNQPQVYQNYTIFVAEVASTCNEALLTHYLLSQTTDPQQRAYLLNHYLEQFRTTLFRQCQLAEFELRVNQLTESGQGVTAEACRGIFRQTIVDYFGPDLTVDQEADLDWARIPHFYYNYYVYQYATGFAAAVALSQRILTGGAQAVEDYLGFLKGGSSQSPIELLKGAGVDMSTPEPINAALAVFGQLTDELESLLTQAD
jgi:oligoendopeptidase F